MYELTYVTNYIPLATRVLPPAGDASPAAPVKKYVGINYIEIFVEQHKKVLLINLFFLNCFIGVQFYNILYRLSKLLLLFRVYDHRSVILHVPAVFR